MNLALNPTHQQKVILMTNTMNEQRQAWRNIGLFILFLIPISGMFVALKVAYGSHTLFTYGMMWAPGLAAIVTCLATKRALSTMLWRFGSWKWHWRGYWVPIAYALAMYLPIWLFNLGGSSFPNMEALHTWSSAFVGDGEFSPVASGIFLLLFVTLGIIWFSSYSLGEEMGWRGFLIWEMRKVMSFKKLSILSGLIWAIYHWPLILLTNYNNGEGNLYLQMALFTLSVSAMGVIYAYFTFRSKALWPVVVLHSSNNLFIQEIFTPLTIKGPGAHFYMDEFGIMMPLVLSVIALYCLRQAKQKGL